MKDITKHVFPVFIGIVIGAIGLLLLKNVGLTFSTETGIVFAIIFIGLILISFFANSASKSDGNAPHALGLPAGSVRAILAITLVIMFILLSLYFYDTVKEKDKLAEHIISILGTLVVAVAAFYFGVKATEQGSNMAHKALQVSQPLHQVSIPPKSIILEALNKNKKNWMTQYHCIDIKIGTKKTNGTNNNLDCIIFTVAKKSDTQSKTSLIPGKISYQSGGINYSIPTDVIQQEQIPSQGQPTPQKPEDTNP